MRENDIRAVMVSLEELASCILHHSDFTPVNMLSAWRNIQFVCAVALRNNPRDAEIGDQQKIESQIHNERRMPSYPQNMIIGIRGRTYELCCTSEACPEQYDVYCDGVMVGYLRLRHGKFIATVPGVGGKAVYMSTVCGDGTFESDERQREIRNALEAITAHYNHREK